MTSATAALQSLEAHRKVVDTERQQMKDDVAFLRDLRRRYTQPLSELPPCRGLPAPVAASARKFLVDTEAYIMRRMSAAQQQSADIANQSENLRGSIQKTADIAHAIAGTTPAAHAYAPGGAGGGGGAGGPSVSHIQTPSVPPTITFADPLPAGVSPAGQLGAGGAASPGGASRYTAAGTNYGGGSASGFGGYGGRPSAASFTSPVPQYPEGAGAGSGGEIRFEPPLGVLPYMTAASQAYRQQQALAYLAADQGVLPRGWAPASLNPQPLVPVGAPGSGSAMSTSGVNVSPSRMRAMEMSGGTNGNTTFVVLPRAGSQEPKRGSSKRFK